MFGLAAAIGFPVVILLLVPLRAILVPRLPFTDEELTILDRPTASPFVSVAPFFYIPVDVICIRLWNLLEGLHRNLVIAVIARALRPRPYAAYVKSDELV